MAAERFYEIRFTVEGEGDFPLDMLRYDRCCPATEGDSRAMAQGGQRRVSLLRFSRAGKSGPCVERWASFGWRVVASRYNVRADRATVGEP